MQVINVFSIREWDGGSMQNHKFYLTSKPEVDAYMDTHRMDSFVPMTIRAFDTVAEYEAWERDELRAKALAKLTSAERAALGF